MFYDIGIDLGATNTKIGLVDAYGKVLVRRVLATRARKGPKQALERVADAIAELRGKRRLRSIGIGIAGLVDHVHGIVRVPPNLPGWNGTPVKAILERLTGTPVYCANDVNAVALGEWTHGAGRGTRDLFCVTLGTGVGGGIISGGRLLLGANHAAGEAGHMTIFGNGPACLCGGYGCVERYVGVAYLVDRARKRIRVQLRHLEAHRNQTALFAGMKPDGPSVILELAGGDLARITPREIGQAARKGDRLALELVGETGYYLGLGLASVVQLIDPERIVMGGGVSRIGLPLLKAVRKTVFSRVQMFPGRRLDIVLSKLGGDAGIIGASRLRRCLAV
jgi:glucokinase